ncbi:multiple epidermal growth factor domains 8-like protein, partial [Plakobranchus ocellatus]
MMPAHGRLGSGLAPSLLLALVLSGFLTWCHEDGSCNGRRVLTESSGNISDGLENYFVNSHCEWLIDAGGPNKTIHLELEEMATECSYDFLFVYDGVSFNDTCIATLSGDSLPHQLTAYSGHMLVYLFSDRNYVQSGFKARYEIFDCPWNCSNHGECRDHKCLCSSSYSGQGCEVKHCPQNCGLHGRCRIHSGQHKCHCNAGYTGQECDLQVAGPGGQGRWYIVRDELGSTGFPARTSHTAIYTQDCIWVFGGFDLNSVKDDLLQFCLKKNVWSKIDKPNRLPMPRPDMQTTTSFQWNFESFVEQTTSRSFDTNTASSGWNESVSQGTENISSGVAADSVATDDNNNSKFEAVSWPAARSDHAMDKFGEGFYIYGGRLGDGSLSNELWFFNISSARWRLCAQDSKVKPPNLMGHTLTAAEGDLYVVGGIDDNHVFVDKVYRISAVNPEQWELIQIWGGAYTTGKIVGHSTIYHPHSGSLIVFGGYIQNSALFSDRSHDILAFHLKSRYWSHLFVGHATKAAVPWKRAFHTSVLMGQYLVVYGGKTHTHNRLESCYNNEIFFYHLGCHVWLNHTYFTNNETMPKKGRFGHTAVVANGNIMFIIGGYSGQVLGDIIAYKVPDAIANYECTAGSKLCSSSAASAEAHDHSPFGTCQAPDHTESGIEGWWDGLSARLTTLQQCQTEDFPAGLHFMKYRLGYNDTFPDEVSIIRRPDAAIDYSSSNMISKKYSYRARLRGFIHPLNPPLKRGKNLTLYLTIEKAKALLYLSTDAAEEHKERVIEMLDFPQSSGKEAYRRGGRPVFPNVTRGNKYFLEQITEQKILSDNHKSSVKLEWNGCIPPKTNMKYQVISSEFLEPYRECPHCNSHCQCSTCVQDVLCEWNVSNGYCSRRYRNKVTEEVIREPSMCTSPCHHRQDCSSCIGMESECVWCHNTHTCLPFSVYLVRHVYGQCISWRDSSNENKLPKCPTCQQHKECGHCLAQFGCGWCGLAHNPGIGLCMEGDFSGVSGNRSCSQLLQDKYDLTEMKIPTPASPSTESALSTVLSNEVPSVSKPLLPSVWAYDQCPDVEECLLGLHDCHPNATCINTFGGYMCQCKKGYKGDGRRFCNLTCFHDCVNGWCSGSPSYKCVCKLGWTNSSCDQDCGCNNHSSCDVSGPGTCDECQHHTSGPKCDKCAPGSWGNASSSEGCKPCECNGHADASLGYCNSKTGDCFCKDNTGGIHCEQCSQGFFGKPRQGGQCYRRCDQRAFLTSSYSGAAGDNRALAESRLGQYLRPWRDEYTLSGTRGNTTLCLWIITTFPDVNYSPRFDEPVPTFVVNVRGDVECGKNAVYVYDGIPEFISASESAVSRELGAFCGSDEKHGMTVYATSGIVTIFFEGDLIEKQGGDFTCTYHALACEQSCNQNQVCEEGYCVCKNGFLGPACGTSVCPDNCSADLGQGYCQNGLCLCREGFTGSNCNESVPPYLPDVHVLTDSTLARSPLSPPFSKHHLPQSLPTGESLGPPPRAGHSLTSCGQDLVFLYGGYAPEEGVFDDMWVLNLTDNTWSLVVPRGERLSPGGRYHHSAACIPLEKMIYVFGGFAPVEERKRVWPSNTMWKFNILSHVWTKALDPPSWMPALVGHSLTHVGTTLLVVTGGFSPELSFNDKVYEYNTSRGVMAWTDIHRKMSGNWPKSIYGHSAVFDKQTQSIYLFGGYRSLNKIAILSDILYVYYIPLRQWTVLTRKNFTGFSDLESRAFHAGVHLGDYMVVLGGMAPGRFGEDILLYRFGCQDWLRLRLTDSSKEPVITAGLGLAATGKGNSIYSFGGFTGSVKGTLSLLRLPPDVCLNVQERDKCVLVEGCHFTNVSTGAAQRGNSSTVALHRCQSNTGLQRCGANSHQCSKHRSCDSCVDDHSHLHPQNPGRCTWCTNCGYGNCIPKSESCPDLHRSCSLALTERQQCRACRQSGNCDLSSFYKRSGEWREGQADVDHQALLAEYVSGPRCHTFKSCRSCLNVNQGKDESSVVCAWSEALQECMLSAYVPLRCSMGECHYMRKWPETCPAACLEYTKCADCMAVAGCGWCSKDGYNGQGFCMEGGISGPTGGTACLNGNITVLMPDILKPGETMKHELKKNSKWAYDVCPPENECSNNHHTCDNATQGCIDYESGYACHCKTGYVEDKRFLPSLGPCVPVCHKPCKNGQCVEPDKCLCNFGYVGSDCSVECKCNRHSDCEDENNISKCLKCEHNTQ